MKEKIIGGVIVLVLGGSTFAVSQTDVVKNFADETGMSQQQAEEYIDKIKGDLASFGEIGEELVKDGESITDVASELDCTTYAYDWESSSLTCSIGKSQLQTIGNNEIKLGECYQALSLDLGDSARAKIDECISDIDTLNKSYNLPIALKILKNNEITDALNTNAYNKSVLKAALES